MKTQHYMKYEKEVAQIDLACHCQFCNRGIPLNSYIIYQIDEYDRIDSVACESCANKYWEGIQ